MRDSLRRLVSTLVGDFTWAPPGWLRRFSDASWVRTHRVSTLLVLLMAVAALASAWWIRDWQRRQPKPVTIDVQIEAPQVTPLKKDLEFPSLMVKFGASVAKIEELSGKPLSSGIRIEPPIDGTWTWANDRSLVFRPKTDWPAARKYRVTLERSLFAPHILLGKYQLDMVTPSFSGTISKAEFYTDPTDPAIKQVVATLEFSHSVDPAALEKHFRATMVGESDVFKKGTPRFAITFGLHRRVAYIRTSALQLLEREDFMRLSLLKGLATVQGGALLEAESEKKVRVPDLFSFFRVESISGLIVRNAEGEPEQMLSVNTTAPAKPSEIQKAVRVYLLPKKDVANPGAEKKEGVEARWEGPKEIDAEVLERSVQLPLQLVASEKADATQHFFKIKLESDGQLLATLPKGTEARGGFLLAEDYSALLPVPELPREIAILGEGGVLALNGERKLLIRSRGVKAIEYEIARVPADQVNHLVSQTRGEFQNPRFANGRFSVENIARIAVEKQSIHLQSRFKANDSAFDFARHLQPATDGGSPLQGLFLLIAREWHAPKKKSGMRPRKRPMEKGTPTRRSPRRGKARRMPQLATVALFS